MRHALLLGTLLASGCYNEGLVIENMKGRVVLPEAAGNRVTSGGNVIEDDIRLIGPVYIGLYPGVQSGTREYPYPEIGPSFQSGLPGNTYPYGGTTVGDIRFACMEFLTCKITSGRFLDFDEIVDWFNVQVDQPIRDAYGNTVETGEYIRQTCFELLEFTSDEEIRMTATKDRNEDGKIDHLDLDFVQRSDGKWEADFTLYQQEYFEGFSMWGWMDAPSQLEYRYSTCDPGDGQTIVEYNQQWDGGRQYRELLNFPSQWIGAGDIVPSADPGTDAYVWDDPYAVHELELDYVVEF